MYPQFTTVHHHHHHHSVSNAFSTLTVMNLNFSRSSAIRIKFPYDFPLHFFMLSIHVILGLPLLRLPLIFPSSSWRCNSFCLIRWPKYWHFRLTMLDNNCNHNCCNTIMSSLTRFVVHLHMAWVRAMDNLNILPRRSYGLADGRCTI